MKRREFCAMAVVLGGSSLAGCVQDAPRTGGNGPIPGSGTGTAGNSPAAASNTIKTKGAGERLKVAVVPKGTTHEFWQTVKKGAEAAGQEFNCEILWNGPKAETDIQDQIDIIKGYVTQGIDGAAIAATDKVTLVDTVKELQSQGLAVVTIDSGIEPDISSSFIATDNVAAARLAADELARIIGKKGKVAVLSFLKGAATSDQREQGFLEGIKAYPDIQVVATEETKSDSAKAQEKLETILTSHADLAGVFAANEPNVVGAASALAGRKLVGKVKLVGFDASQAEIQSLEKGECQAVIVQDPFKMGYEGVKAIAQLVRGEGTPDKRIDTGAKVVTPENMKTPEMEKLLYPMGKK